MGEKGRNTQVGTIYRDTGGLKLRDGATGQFETYTGAWFITGVKTRDGL